MILASDPQRVQPALVQMVVLVLVVLFSFTLTVAPAFLSIGILGASFSLLFCALRYSSPVAWRCCLLGIGVYGSALLLRHVTAHPTLAVGGEPWLALYGVPPLAFALATWFGITLHARFARTFTLNTTLQHDLHDRRAEYRCLLQTMNEGFAIVDEHEIFTYVNDKFCEIFGYTRAELLNHSHLELFNYDAASLVMVQEQIAIRTQRQRSSYELCAQRKNGAPVIFRVSAMPKIDAQGVFRGATAVVMDVTAQKQMEATLQAERALLSQHVAAQTASLRTATAALQQELVERTQVENTLRATEEIYRTLFDQVPIGLYRASLDGRQLSANPALVLLNGYGSEAEMLAAVNQATGEAWYVEPDRRTQFQQALATQGHVTNFEAEIYRHKTRERIWISESATLVRDQQGEPLYYQGVVQDITRHKQIAQEQERLLAQSTKIARLKDEFLASMSHELRTPLNSILGMTEALTDEIYGVITPRQRKALSTIDASGRHLLSLINDILDLAKIESGQIELTYGTVDVDALCQSTLRLVQTTAQKKKLAITFSLDPEVKTLVADGRRLKQILLNLLSNAIKFTMEEGEISLTVLGRKGDSPTVQFMVRDSGVGIPADALENLFKPFVQVDSSLSRQFDGTGLGLALVHRMVEMHGGTVTVVSDVGKGSTFIVTLPWKNYSGLNPASDTLARLPVRAGAANGEAPAVAVMAPIPERLPTAHDVPAASPVILLAEDNPFTVQGV
jgi:PAS domain S-box-containing protein